MESWKKYVENEIRTCLLRKRKNFSSWKLADWITEASPGHSLWAWVALNLRPLCIAHLSQVLGAWWVSHDKLTSVQHKRTLQLPKCQTCLEQVLPQVRCQGCLEERKGRKTFYRWVTNTSEGIDKRKRKNLRRECLWQRMVIDVVRTRRSKLSVKWSNNTMKDRRSCSASALSSLTSTKSLTLRS